MKMTKNNILLGKKVDVKYLFKDEIWVSGVVVVYNATNLGFFGRSSTVDVMLDDGSIESEISTYRLIIKK